MSNMTDLEEDWFNFCDGNDISNDNLEPKDKKGKIIDEITIPKCSDIYISTKTKIAFLNCQINLYEIFWKIIVNEYHNPIEGVIKKQMKFNSNSVEELENIKTKLNDLHKNDHIDEYVLNHIDNPNGRIKFKDVRKISVGLSKKDITSYRCKKKSAFYNCFVLIIRLLNNNIFKEIHVKIFNTGKLEIPGIQNDEIFSNSNLDKDKYHLINIWASWCLPCRKEHPILMSLSRENNLSLIGVNFKDKKLNANNFLKELGNPYNILLSDKDGTNSIVFGVYGVPESILINKRHKVLKKFIGPLDDNDYKNILKLINEK